MRFFSFPVCECLIFHTASFSVSYNCVIFFLIVGKRTLYASNIGSCDGLSLKMYALQFMSLLEFKLPNHGDWGREQSRSDYPSNTFFSML